MWKCRWHQLARLAQAGWLFKEKRFSEKCVEWLENWIISNSPYLGWNWTSALEAGLRLIQFAWMDALLSEGPDFADREKRMTTLREKLLAPHARFTWRYRSFGSSANNHLLGELAGLIVASVRWPALARACADLTTLRLQWEKTVLAQFAEDGGNREQALNYHLFSWELCFQASLALTAAGEPINSTVTTRLENAARFYVIAQADREPWDYGDSDDAFVAPFVGEEEAHSTQWKRWMRAEQHSGLSFWFGRKAVAVEQPKGWEHFKSSGYLIFRSDDWFLRWDVSPLGYLKTAAHGHLDVLHLSLWFRNMAVVVDPGTGAYYGDAALRNFLASHGAHNGPAPLGKSPVTRRGPFLWDNAHAQPSVAPEGTGFKAQVPWLNGRICRTVTPLEKNTGWEVNDQFATEGTQNGFGVLWQFAPGIKLERTGEGEIAVIHASAKLILQLGQNWSRIELGMSASQAEPGEGTVSSHFRQKGFRAICKADCGFTLCLFSEQVFSCGRHAMKTLSFLMRFQINNNLVPNILRRNRRMRSGDGLPVSSSLSAIWKWAQ